MKSEPVSFLKLIAWEQVYFQQIQHDNNMARMVKTNILITDIQQIL